MRGKARPLPRECPAWVRACHSGREFRLRPATLSSRRSPVRESADAPGLGDVPEPQSLELRDLSLRQRWLPWLPGPPGYRAHLPDEVGAVAAEGGLLEEAGDEFVVLHLVHVLLPQRPFAGEAVGHVLRRRGVVGRVNVSHGPPQPPLASAGEQQPGRAGVGGGGGRGGGAEVRWWRRWPGRAWPALRCSELGAEPRSLALRLSRSLAGPTLTDSPAPGARASYSRQRQEAARSGAAHCACPESKRVYGCTRARAGIGARATRARAARAWGLFAALR